MVKKWSKNKLNSVLREDQAHMLGRLSDAEKAKFSGSTILVTGCAGFLGFGFLEFLVRQSQALGIESVIGLDTFLFGKPDWLSALESEFPNVLRSHKFDVSKDDVASVPGANKANLIIHGASIASPIFYRQYPIVTLDANIWGLRRLLDFYSPRDIKGFLFFSSSEIYGDPVAEAIPTDEEYRGNVSCIGPRACYDESKRFGETMCYLFAGAYQTPITVARPFNNFGPGMRIDDGRVPADFAKAILEGRDIEILSSGSPTRTFCYVADALAGYLKCLTHGKFDYFNIGIEGPEISVRELADIYAQLGADLCGYTGKVIYAKSGDADYLTHNPNRRCPKIGKAREILGYDPTIEVKEGVAKFLRFLIEERGHQS
ncbi:MAG TPA: NAD-dependent epimerase/dehydratase family protein [Fimbriimonadaceae bacterium]|jgi:UDP-glucuronate decarboxylase